jgi:hypothetical protein
MHLFSACGIEARGEITVNRPGRLAGSSAAHFSNVGGESDAAEKGLRHFGVGSEPERRKATTTSPLQSIVHNQTLLLAGATRESTTGVDRQ